MDLNRSIFVFLLSSFFIIDDNNYYVIFSDVDSTLNTSMYDDDQTVPVTVIKRPRKPIDLSKFNRSNRKSKNCATFYFKHHDTDSDRQMVSGASGTEDKSQEETSEEEWTYTVCAKNGSPENSDIMTSSFEQQSELSNDDLSKNKQNARIKLDFENSNMTKYETDDVLNEKNITMDQKLIESQDVVAKPIEHIAHQPLCSKESIKRLLNEAEVMVLRKVQQMNAASMTKNSAKKSKVPRNFKPLELNNEGRVHSQNKISRIKEWLQLQHTDNTQMVYIISLSHAFNNNIIIKNVRTFQILDSCDASGEYTTGDSEPDRVSVTSEDRSPSVATYRNVTSSQEHSINVETPTNHSTPEHTKVRIIYSLFYFQ